MAWLTKSRPLTLFIYGLSITLLAFIARETHELLLIALPNGVAGITLGIIRRLRLLIALFFLGLIGLLINAIAFSNVGPPILELYLITIREGALIAFTNVTLRLVAILGVTLLFITQVNARDFIESLEREARLPKELAYAVAVGLRMLSIFERDLREIQLIRVERGYRRYPITPQDVASFLRPLLSLGLERALWVGVASELRGFTYRKVVRRSIRLGFTDLITYAALVIQILIVLLS